MLLLVAIVMVGQAGTYELPPYHGWLLRHVVSLVVCHHLLLLHFHAFTTTVNVTIPADGRLASDSLSTPLSCLPHSAGHGHSTHSLSGGTTETARTGLVDRLPIRLPFCFLARFEGQLIDYYFCAPPQVRWSSSLAYRLCISRQERAVATLLLSFVLSSRYQATARCSLRFSRLSPCPTG